MKVYTGIFSPRTGTGTQTITGIVDTGGAAFTPEWVLFTNNGTPNNTLGYGGLGGNANGWAWNSGVDNGTEGASGGTATRSQFGGKIGSGGAATRYSLTDLGANAFFGGDIYREAYISAFGSGEFTLTYDKNDRTGDTVIFHAFAATGGELVLDEISAWSSGRVPPVASFAEPPQAVLWWPTASALSTTKGATAGAGGSPWGFGWATRSDGLYGATSASSESLDGTASYQALTAPRTNITSLTTGATQQGPTINPWASGSWTGVAHDIGATATSVVFGGTNLLCVSGSFTQKATTGTQVVSLGIDAKWVMIQTVGRPTFASTTAYVGRSELSIGFTDGTRQSNQWAGETGTSPTADGARYTSDSTMLRIAGSAINGASTTFGSVAALSSLSGGNLTLNWTASDGGGAEIIWFAIGEALPGTGSVRVTKTETPTGTTTFTFKTLGLTPTTFTLSDGETRLFTEVLSAGGYSVQEANAPTYTTTYTVSTGEPASNFTVTASETVTIDVSNAAIEAEPPIRWLRRTPHAVNELKRVFYRRLDLLMDTGVGGDTEPTVYMRYSNDGGKTWNTAKAATYGASGQYSKRVYWAPLGSGRDRVFEVYGDDDAPVRIVDAYIDVTPGQS